MPGGLRATIPAIIRLGYWLLGLIIYRVGKVTDFGQR